jgi:enamine deaminase RidA (YjgF/YER057c/UK114 family)
LKRRTIQPSSLFDSSDQGFSHGVLVEGGKKILFIAGQLALDKKGNFVGGNLTEQYKMAMDNLGAVLKEAGAEWRNVVKSTAYVTDMPESIREFVKITKRYFTDEYPAGTLVEVKGLGFTGQLIEIDAIAVI